MDLLELAGILALKISAPFPHADSGNPDLLGIQSVVVPDQQPTVEPAMSTRYQDRSRRQQIPPEQP